MKYIPLILFTITATTPIIFAEPITWEAAVQKAAKQNPDLLAAQKDLEKAHYAYRKSYAAFMPQLSANASYRHSQSEVGVNRQFNSQDTYTLGLNGDQNLFAGFRDSTLVEQSLAQLKVSEAVLQERRLNTGNDLAVAFTQLNYATQLLDLSRKIKERRQLNRNLVQLRYEGGREHKGSFLLSEANLKAAEFEIKQAERLIESGTAELARIFGEPIDEQIAIEGPWPNLPLEVNSDLNEIITTHPALQQEISKVKVAQAGIAIADSKFYPQVNINASVSRSDFSWFPQNNGWAYGLSASYPLFNGGKDYYESKSARAEFERSQNQLNSRKLQLQTTIVQARQQYKNAQDNIQVAKSLYEASETRAKISRAQYSNGLLTFENWDIIENDLINRQRTLLTAEREARLAEAALLKASGKGLLP